MSLLLATVSLIPAGQAFTCTPTRVWDGDGRIWCAEGPRSRLSGIAARETDGSCRRASRVQMQAPTPPVMLWCNFSASRSADRRKVMNSKVGSIHSARRLDVLE
jgi:hypothetical protein